MSGLEHFVLSESEDFDNTELSFFEELRERIDRVKEADNELKGFARSNKKKEKNGIEFFMSDIK